MPVAAAAHTTWLRCGSPPWASGRLRMIVPAPRIWSHRRPVRGRRAAARSPPASSRPPGARSRPGPAASSSDAPGDRRVRSTRTYAPAAVGSPDGALHRRPCRRRLAQRPRFPGRVVEGVPRRRVAASARRRSRIATAALPNVSTPDGVERRVDDRVDLRAGRRGRSCRAA